MAQYNRYAIRRTVRLQEAVNEVAVFTTKSFTQPGADDCYHPIVDTLTGDAICDCPHFVYRLAKHHPTINDSEHLCKHLLRAVSTLKRRFA